MSVDFGGRLSSLSVDEVVGGIGKVVITQELGGDIMMGVLVDVSVGDWGVDHIVVDKGDGSHVIWSTQWAQAVFA